MRRERIRIIAVEEPFSIFVFFFGKIRQRLNRVPGGVRREFEGNALVLQRFAPAAVKKLGECEYLFAGVYYGQR